MFDAEFFTARLRRDADALGAEPIVEVSLLNGHTHRIRAVLDVRDGYVVLEAYHLKGDLAHQHPRFVATGASPAAGGSTFHVSASFESIAAVVIDPSASQPRARPGFA